MTFGQLVFGFFCFVLFYNSGMYIKGTRALALGLGKVSYTSDAYP